MRLQEIDWREEIGIARRRLQDVGGTTNLDAHMPDVNETRQVLACANIGTLTRLSAYEVPYASWKHPRKGLMGDCMLSQEVGRFQSVTEGTKHGCPRAATFLGHEHVQES